ncbi:MAG: glycosyltransferase family 2 protein [Winogradskyella sp.]|uniref:glycosyltransferase family 2 protein n=1 Tax=Winogradskyella sp. TaxID=1883156 RepID=UPI0025FC07F0|nr:glycosyltransferase family A protein [Winogradskyella sp.]NRB59413.1 glycosyltransferase family 2 protein [Winogradskyella sp.]
MNPLVSIIIPTYNRTDYLKLTLESVINQTYPNIEIIVVDDGSTNDNNRVLCNQYAKVNYYMIKNSGGPATPRNYGFKKSNGQYIAFLDDDDLWQPNKLTEQVKILENNLEFGLVHCYCDVIDKYGKLTGKSIGRPKRLDDKHGDVRYKMIGNWTLKMPTPLIRRSVVDSIGLFNVNIPSALEDVEFWTRCSFYTKFYYLDKSLALYRVHKDNISATKQKYVDLPLHLKQIIDNEIKSENISKTEYKILLNNICKSQAKHINISCLKTFLNLNKLNPFWMINFRLLKVIVKRVIT